MRRHNDAQRLKKHVRCGNTNTTEIGLSDDDYGLVYIGWCHECLTSFQYRLKIDNIEDKAGRI